MANMNQLHWSAFAWTMSVSLWVQMESIKNYGKLDQSVDANARHTARAMARMIRGHLLNTKPDDRKKFVAELRRNFRVLHNYN